MINIGKGGCLGRCLGWGGVGLGRGTWEGSFSITFFFPLKGNKELQNPGPHSVSVAFEFPRSAICTSVEILDAAFTIAKAETPANLTIGLGVANQSSFSSSHTNFMYSFPTFPSYIRHPTRRQLVLILYDCFKK